MSGWRSKYLWFFAQFREKFSLHIIKNLIVPLFCGCHDHYIKVLPDRFLKPKFCILACPVFQTIFVFFQNLTSNQCHPRLTIFGSIESNVQNCYILQTEQLGDTNLSKDSHTSKKWLWFTIRTCGNACLKMFRCSKVDVGREGVFKRVLKASQSYLGPDQVLSFQLSNHLYVLLRLSFKFVFRRTVFKLGNLVLINLLSVICFYCNKPPSYN